MYVVRHHSVVLPQSHRLSKLIFHFFWELLAAPVAPRICKILWYNISFNIHLLRDIFQSNGMAVQTINPKKLKQERIDLNLEILELRIDSPIIGDPVKPLGCAYTLIKRRTRALNST